jgi:hypothetical protein
VVGDAAPSWNVDVPNVILSAHGVADGNSQGSTLGVS